MQQQLNSRIKAPAHSVLSSFLATALTLSTACGASTVREITSSDSGGASGEQDQTGGQSANAGSGGTLGGTGGTMSTTGGTGGAGATSGGSAGINGGGTTPMADPCPTEDISGGNIWECTDNSNAPGACGGLLCPCEVPDFDLTEDLICPSRAVCFFPEKVRSFVLRTPDPRTSVSCTLDTECNFAAAVIFEPQNSDPGYWRATVEPPWFVALYNYSPYSPPDARCSFVDEGQCTLTQWSSPYRFLIATYDPQAPVRNVVFDYTPLPQIPSCNQ